MTGKSVRSTLTGVSIAALLISTASVYAADMDPIIPPAPPPPVPELKPSVYDWSGPYVGVIAGAGLLKTFYLPSGSPDPELAGDGYQIGGLAGYNMQYGNYVFGLEGDLSWGNIKASNSLDQVSFKVPVVATARVRVGRAFDRTLIYLTGGLGIAKGKMHLTALGQEDKKTHYGFVVGGGIEHAIANQLSFKLEYLYGEYEKKTYRFPSGTVNMGLDAMHLVRAGLSWNFGPDL